MPEAGRSWRATVRPLLMVVLAAAGLGLGWAVVVTAMTGALTETDPVRALQWGPGNSAALAEAAAASYPSAGGRAAAGTLPPLEALRARVDEADALARRALAVSPLRTRALQVSGYAAAQRGEAERALALMTMAADRDLRDPAAQLWMFNYRMGRHQYAQALDNADTLLRLPGTRRLATMRLAAAASRDALARQALADPRVGRWGARAQVSTEMARAGSAGALFDLLIRASEAGSDIDQAETAALVRRLIADGHPDQAYLAWAQLLPPEGRVAMGNVYDGEFDGRPGAPPFNWTGINGKTSLLASTPDRPGEGLHVRYEGDRPAQLVSQMLLLAPGTYRLRMLAYVEGEGLGDELAWTVACLGGTNAQLTEVAAPDAASTWTEITGQLRVPPSGCQNQVLTLSGRPSPSLDFVKAWFDGVLIEPVEAA